MSNIYIQEPPTNGKVLLKTTVGDIDLELWSKETPKACRNFIQLCMEGYYNGTIFHRVVKGFIIQGGDPTGTGTGGESIYGHPFKDEFHSRLRFNRRGLVAMANAGRDDNSSQFFFTLAAAPELQNKHTIFGKVGGETIFNMLKLEDALVDKDDKPMYPQKILKAEILFNPFPDIVPRTLPADETEVKTGKSKKEKRTGVKNFKLLSFGEEAEEDEEETNEANRKYSGRSKSTHDILNDPNLSNVPAVETKKTEGEEENDSALSEDEECIAENNLSTKDSEEVDNIRKKLRMDKGSGSKTVTTKLSKDSEHEEDSDGERHDEKRRKVEDIKREIRELKKEFHNEKKRKDVADEEEANEKANQEAKTHTLEAYKQEHEMYKQLKERIPKKGTSREDFTLKLLAKFQKKLANAKEKALEKSDVDEAEPSHSDDKMENEDEDWLTHQLRFEANVPVLAKDASTKGDDWFEIYDPRNPINKRRRETSKDLMKSKEKR
ncbi:Peptidyl-prolyl cis-trans isomerase CWC27 [Blattella germanica]|nr:Peptidyl-prolyl cis-trans isomerase CWC27 [Blattella germanica]